MSGEYPVLTDTTSLNGPITIDEIRFAMATAGKGKALGCDDIPLEQWCSGGGATGAIAPVPIFQGGAPLQFLFHLFLVNFDCILQKLAYYLNY